jgi:hypothetical protein
MKYFLASLVFVLSVASAKTATDAICYDETQEEICESFHIECGVTIRLTECGKEKTVTCTCRTEDSCSLESLKCQQSPQDTFRP